MQKFYFDNFQGKPIISPENTTYIWDESKGYYFISDTTLDGANLNEETGEYEILDENQYVLSFKLYPFKDPYYSKADECFEAIINSLEFIGFDD